MAVGLGVGANAAFADLDKKTPSYSIIATGDYYITPFLTAGLEFQNGLVTGGDRFTDPHLRYFKNNYTSITANGKISIGQVVNVDLYPKWYFIRNLYMGTGIGVIMNNQKEIVRNKPRPDGTIYTFPGKDKSMGLLLPAEIGMNFDLKTDYWGYTRFVVSAKYQFNVTFGEGLDGYNDPPTIFKNVSPDMLGVGSIGIKYTFGPEGLW
ncbi:hypothetical protein [Rubrolithibacter danxiaensis]|uniref:hypothetical protein n=1 Tax=Rubrolithibacter danxiaensis TaxID=3390805 RepID=UPI003BF8A5E3